MNYKRPNCSFCEKIIEIFEVYKESKDLVYVFSKLKSY